MNCPSCGKNISRLAAGDIEIDACTSGCGGIWFDREELIKFDEPHEFKTHAVLELAKKQEAVRVDHKRQKKCPVCPDEMLIRQLFDTKNEVEIDQCWECGGIWLDVGEINKIRGQYETMAERSDAVNSYVDTMLEDTRKKMSADTKEQLARYDQETKNAFKAAIYAFKELLGK